MKRGSTLYHVHGDHLGSTSVTTAGAVVEGSRAYYPYGAQRSASGTLRTDRTFTGQKEDGTGLLYYNARYYDPALGTFISPDSLVPDLGMVVDYNRFLYARGNPLKYSDPTGRFPFGPDWEREFETEHGRPPDEEDRFDRLVSVMIPGSGPGGTWTNKDWRSYTATKVAIRQALNDRTRSIQQDWLYRLKQETANAIHWVIPPGGTSIGLTASTGVVADFTGETGLFFDKSGNFYIGLSGGVGASTGANFDVGIFFQYFPWASGAEVIEDWTVNVGISGVIGPPVFIPVIFAGVGGALEINVATDPKTEGPTIGFTVAALEGIKSNLPFPPVEFYGNATRTWFLYRLNLYDWLGLPRPEQ